MQSTRMVLNMADSHLLGLVGKKTTDVWETSFRGILGILVVAIEFGGSKLIGKLTLLLSGKLSFNRRINSNKCTKAISRSDRKHFGNKMHLKMF